MKFGVGDINCGFDEEFLPWYAEAADNAKMDTMAVQNVLLERRTVTNFDATPISEAVLRRAIECAIRAPNYSESEPWRFIGVGPETARQIAQLRVDQLMENGNYEGAGALGTTRNRLFSILRRMNISTARASGDGAGKIARCQIIHILVKVSVVSWMEVMGYHSRKAIMICVHTRTG